MKRTAPNPQSRTAVPPTTSHALIVRAPVAEEDEFDAVPETHDAVLQPPMWLFILGTLEVLWGALTNILQASTSFIAILSWLQSDTVSTLGPLRGAQAIITRNLPFALIALVIAVGSQMAIQISSQQISRQWKQRRIAEHESRRQAMVEIASQAGIGTIFGAVGFLACAVSDYTFVTLLDANLLIMAFWAIILACSSTYVLIDGIERIWAGVLAHRAWVIWQEALRDHAATHAHL